MSIRIQITPDDFKRSKIVKPGWYPTLIREITIEINSKKDANNVVLDCENADNESEFYQVPVKHWMSEKVPYMPGGLVGLALAFDPKMDQTKIADVDYELYKGRYIYAKWETSRGKDGQDPPRNVIADWAPLGPKHQHLKEGVVSSPDVEGFAKV